MRWAQTLLSPSGRRWLKASWWSLQRGSTRRSAIGRALPPLSASQGWIQPTYRTEFEPTIWVEEKRPTRPRADLPRGDRASPVPRPVRSNPATLNARHPVSRGPSRPTFGKRHRRRASLFPTAESRIVRVRPVNWSSGHAGWTEVLHTVLLESYQDGWILFGCAIAVVVNRYAQRHFVSRDRFSPSSDDVSTSA